MQDNILDGYITTEDVYKMLGGFININTVYKLIRTKKFDSVKIGGKILIKKQSVIDYINKQ